MYVDPVLVGPLHLDEQRGLFSFTVSLSIYWQVCVILTRTTKVYHQLPLVQLILDYIQDFRLVIRPDLNKSTWQHVSFWASAELWLPEVRSLFGQDRPPHFVCLPCILCIAQVSFANLERVEVLGLPGSEGELRVRGDKTVTTTSDANLFVAWLEISLIGFMQNG